MCKPKDEGSLGFKDLRAFKMALLAKQCWRLMTCTSSLLYQIYKAKYLPHHSFDIAQLGPSPSYTWCGFLQARKLIQDGSWWSIGIGQLIDLWRDAWLLGHKNLIHLRPTEEGTHVPTMVSDIINHGQARWNTVLVHQLFPQTSLRTSS